MHGRNVFPVAGDLSLSLQRPPSLVRTQDLSSLSPSRAPWHRVRPSTTTSNTALIEAVGRPEPSRAHLSPCVAASSSGNPLVHNTPALEHAARCHTRQEGGRCERTVGVGERGIDTTCCQFRKCQRNALRSYQCADRVCESGQQLHSEVLLFQASCRDAANPPSNLRVPHPSLSGGVSANALHDGISNIIW